MKRPPVVFDKLPNGVRFEDFCRIFWLINEYLWDEKVVPQGRYVRPRDIYKMLRRPLMKNGENV